MTSCGDPVVYSFNHVYEQRSYFQLERLILRRANVPWHGSPFAKRCDMWHRHGIRNACARNELQKQNSGGQNPGAHTAKESRQVRDDKGSVYIARSISRNRPSVTKSILFKENRLFSGNASIRISEKLAGRPTVWQVSCNLLREERF
jgi:hypothetical protein